MRLGDVVRTYTAAEILAGHYERWPGEEGPPEPDGGPARTSGFLPAFEGPDPPPTLTLKLHSLQEGVELGTTLSESWFRGHPEVHGTLTPRIFRRQFTDSIVEKLRPSREADTITSSMRRLLPIFRFPTNLTI